MTHDDFDTSFDPQREPLSQGQLDALTEALNQLTSKIEQTAQPGAPSPMGGQQQPNNIPWWFKWKPQYPGAPDFDPAVIRTDALHQQWWARSTAGKNKPTGAAMQDAGDTADGAGSGGKPPTNRPAASGADEPDPQGFSFVRSFWRRKARKAERRKQAEERANPSDGGAPWVGEYKSRPWKRSNRKNSWFSKFTRRMGARAGGGRAGRAVQQGLGAAGQSLMWGGSVQFAARRGIANAAMAAGPEVAGVALLGLAAVEAAKYLNQMTREQIEYSRHLANASAQMAAVVAERDISQAMRDREKGDRLSDSARALMKSEQFKEENMKELDIAWDRAKNYIGAGWESFKGALFWQLNQEAGLMNRMVEWTERGVRKDEELKTTDEWVKEIARKDAEARKRNDPKWKKPDFGEVKGAS